MGALGKLIDFLKKRLSTEDLAEFLKILDSFDTEVRKDMIKYMRDL